MIAAVTVGSIPRKVTRAWSLGVERVQALTARAVETLVQLLPERRHPAVRLGAARSIIEFATSRDDAVIILSRIEELECVQREATKR